MRLAVPTAGQLLAKVSFENGGGQALAKTRPPRYARYHPAFGPCCTLLQEPLPMLRCPRGLAPACRFFPDHLITLFCVSRQ